MADDMSASGTTWPRRQKTAIRRQPRSIVGSHSNETDRDLPCGERPGLNKLEEDFEPVVKTGPSHTKSEARRNEVALTALPSVAAPFHSLPTNTRCHEWSAPTIVCAVLAKHVPRARSA
jgi:hypothetical protein